MASEEPAAGVGSRQEASSDLSVSFAPSLSSACCQNRGGGVVQ